MYAYKEKSREMNAKDPLQYKSPAIQFKKLKDNNKEGKKSNNSYSYENRAKLTQGLLKKEKQIKYAQVPNTVKAQVGENSRLSIDDLSDMYKVGKTAQLKALNITKSLNFLFNLRQAKYAENYIQEPIEKKTAPIQKKENRTGIPDNLKNAVENKSGLSMDDVKVYYNSSKPKQLGALAYTQGSEIHVGPGQEKHLSHELGHVVQQKQGRVKPIAKVNGFNVNNDERLEREADSIGNIVHSKLIIQRKENVVQLVKHPKPDRPTASEKKSDSLFEQAVKILDSDEFKNMSKNKLSRLEKLLFSENYSDCQKAIKEIQKISKKSVIPLNEIRKKYYPGTFNQHVLTWKKSKIGKDKKFLCAGCGKRFADITIDHKRPVSKHWNTVGYKSNQNIRNVFYNKITNFQLLCTKCNSQKGGEKYKKYPDFANGFSPN